MRLVNDDEAPPSCSGFFLFLDLWAVNEGLIRVNASKNHLSLGGHLEWLIPAVLLRTAAGS